MKHPRPERLVFQGGAKPGEHAQVKFMLIGAGDDHDDEMDRQGIHADVIWNSTANQCSGGDQISGGGKPDMRNRDTETDTRAQKFFPRMDGLGESVPPRGPGERSEKLDQSLERFVFTGFFEHGTSIRREAAE